MELKKEMKRWQHKKERDTSMWECMLQKWHVIQMKQKRWNITRRKRRTFNGKICYWWMVNWQDVGDICLGFCGVNLCKPFNIRCDVKILPNFNQHVQHYIYHFNPLQEWTMFWFLIYFKTAFKCPKYSTHKSLLLSLQFLKRAWQI